MVSNIDSYSFLKKIGQGSFGEVWLVEQIFSGNEKFVLKKINFVRASSKERESARQECIILKSLEHPNIVQYKDSFEENNTLYIAMAFCEGGDLYTSLEERDGSLFPENQIVEWLIQITMALSYIHERNILHRDLKTQNIFLTKSIIKIGDLGIAKRLKNESDMAKTVIGTPYYMSPELFQNKAYNFKSDIWSLGCVTYEMVTLKHAFNAKNYTALSYKIINGQTPYMPSKYSKELTVLIQDMLNKSPEKRPSTTRILRHPFIQQHIRMFVENSKSKSERQSRYSAKHNHHLEKKLNDDKSEINYSPVESDNESLVSSKGLSNINKDLSKEPSIMVENNEKRAKRRQDKRSQGFQTFKFPNSNENHDIEKRDDDNNDINENNRNPRSRRKKNSINEDDKTFMLPDLKSAEYVGEDKNNFPSSSIDTEISANIVYKKRNKRNEVPKNLDLDYEDGKSSETFQLTQIECKESDKSNKSCLSILKVIEKMNENLNIQGRSENIIDSNLMEKSQKEPIIIEPIENEQETLDRKKYFNERYHEIKKEIISNVGFENLNKCLEVLRNLDLDHEKQLKDILNDNYEKYCGAIIWLKMIDDYLTENMVNECEKCITNV